MRASGCRSCRTRSSRCARCGPKDRRPPRQMALDIDGERELLEREHENAALDAYSTIVTTVAELVIPSIASLQVSHRTRNGRLAHGAGSAVAITPDGFLVTSAHVVDGAQ